MKAILVSDGLVTVEDNYPKPKPEVNQALIRVTMAGVCSTDLEIVKGYANFNGIIGHEFVGVVEEAPEIEWVGKRVVGSINLGCDNCEVCWGDGPEHCPHRTVLGIIGHNGAFAEYLTLPMRNLVRVPDHVPDEQAVFTEPLAAALQIGEQLIVPPSSKVAVIGPGRLGLLIGQVLALSGTDITMIGRSQESLELPVKLGLQSGVKGDFAVNSFDIVIEVTGNDQGFAYALELLRPLGSLVLKSTYAGSAYVDLSKIVVDEITVVGSRCGPFEPALRLLASNHIDVNSMIDARYSLSDGVRAIEHSAKSGVRKVLLQP